MGKSLWVLVDRYDPVIRFLRLRLQLLDEYGDPHDTVGSYKVVLGDVVQLREAAAESATKLEGPRAP